MLHPIKDKYKGCLVGLAIGDALGAPFEFWRREAIEDFFVSHKLELADFVRGGNSFPAGFYTDDTAMMLCLAASLVENEFDLQDQYNRYKKWLWDGYMTPSGDRSYGVGQQTLKALSRDLPVEENLTRENPRAGGNGSLMRCAPIGLKYQGNFEEIRDKSILSSSVTHNYTIAGWTCVVLNTILSLSIDNVSKHEVLLKVLEVYRDEIPQTVADVLSFPYDSFEEALPVSGYCVDTLRIAIWAWITSENYTDTIMKCFTLESEDSEGNDTDTFAAVAGALAGCSYGYEQIPLEYRQRILNHDVICSFAQKLFESSQHLTV